MPRQGPPRLRLPWEHERGAGDVTPHAHETDKAGGVLSRQTKGETVTIGALMAPKVCIVRFEDAEGTVHTVTVSASSLYKAVGLAVQAFTHNPGRHRSLPPPR